MGTDYELRHREKKVGTFPLEELRQRREAGLLTGTELVWCAGMDGWKPLDAVLKQAALEAAQALAEEEAAAAAGQTEPDGPKGSRKVLWISAIAGGVVLLAGAGIGGYVVFKDKFRPKPKPAPFNPEQFAKKLSQMLVAQQKGQQSPRSGPPAVVYSGLWPDQPAEDTRRASSRTVEIAKTPLPANPNTRTEADVRKKLHALQSRVWLEGYRQNGIHDPSVDTAITDFLKAWVDLHYGDGEQTMPDVFTMADQLAANPACKDPLALTAIATCRRNRNDSLKTYERALQGFPQSRHKAYAALYCTVSLAEAVRFPTGERVPTLDASALPLLKTALNDGSFSAEEHPEAAEIFLRGWGAQFFERNSGSIFPLAAALGPPGEWLAAMLEGDHHVNAAWKARGSGLAYTVSQQGWAGFKAEMEQAGRCFTKAWELRADQPLACSRMITVAMGQNDPAGMRQWFDRALSVQLDHPDAWEKLRWGIRPRWFGSQSTMVALGAAAVNTGRFDTEVPRKLFDVLEDLQEETSQEAGQVYRRMDVWPHIQRMYEGYLAALASEPTLKSWRSSYIVVAYLAGKYEVARAQLELLNWQMEAVPQHAMADPAIVPLEVAARTGPHGGLVDQAEQLHQKGDTDGALKQYAALEKETGLDERTRKFVQARQVALRTKPETQPGAMPFNLRQFIRPPAN